MVRIAALDLDDTVVDGDSQELFIRFLREHGLAPASLLLEVAFWFALNRLGCPLEVPTVYARLVLRCSSIPRPELERAMAEFVATRLPGRIRTDAKKWISRLRREGCHIVLLSASLDPIVEPLAEMMRVDGSIGTSITLDRPGRLEVVGEMVYGEAKVRALEAYANRRFAAWSLEYAFGNDYADRFLLRAAAHPVAVCPSTRLRAIAEREAWPCATWR